MIDFQKAKQYVFNLLGSDLSKDFIYHDIQHTLDVYQSATRLGTMAKLSESELLLLQTAALFHDVGLIYGEDKHEAVAAEIVREILPEYGYSEEDIVVINQMIMATKLPQAPHTKLDELLCDADLGYLGRDDFFLLAAKLHLEWKRMGIHEMDFDRWIIFERDFMKSHQYFTAEARKLNDEGKKNNLRQLLKIGCPQ